MPSGRAATVCPLASAAQQSATSKRLAIFSPSEPNADLHEHSGSSFSQALFTDLRRLGQIEGQNLKVEAYGREQGTSGLEALATEIVRSNPDIIFVVGVPIFFKKLTSRIPIVAITSDPVRQGIAESLAPPGRQFHGESASMPVHPFMENGSDCCARSFPRCRRLAVLFIDRNGMGRLQVPQSAQPPKRPASVSRYPYWKLLPAKLAIGRRSRASPATVQMRSWSSIRLRSFKTAL